MAYEAKILLDSINPEGNRLTTMVVTYPRFVHSELLTHRMLSRNSSSSRAIPISKMIEQVESDPVLPVWWGKNQSGMQAKEELEEPDLGIVKRDWLRGRDIAVGVVEELSRRGLHKQIANRLLEPWMWITVIVSATEWENFFNLRCHPDAQPEIQKIAYMMRNLYNANEPTLRQVGEWHLPLVDGYDLTTVGSPESSSPAIKKNETEWYVNDSLTKISVGRCARVSYLTHEGVRDPQADIDLCDRLQASGHMSPFEHVANVADKDISPQYYGNFKGWVQYRKTLSGENIFKGASNGR